MLTPFPALFPFLYTAKTSPSVTISHPVGEEVSVYGRIRVSLMARRLQDPQRERGTGIISWLPSMKITQLFIFLLPHASFLSHAFHASQVFSSFAQRTTALATSYFIILFTKAKCVPAFQVQSLEWSRYQMSSFSSALPPFNNMLRFSFPPVQKCHAYISNQQTKKGAYFALLSLILVKNINICPEAISGFKDCNMVLGTIGEVFCCCCFF